MYTLDPENSCTRLVLIRQEEEDTRYDDIAKGVGGLFCYIVPVKTTDKQKVYAVAQWKSVTPKNLLDVKARGWDGMTEDDRRPQQRSWWLLHLCDLENSRPK